MCLMAGSGGDLLLVDRDVRELGGDDLLEELQIVYVSTDWFLAIGDGDLAVEPFIETVVRGPVSPEDFVLVHLGEAGDVESAGAVGEVLLCRGKVALVKPDSGAVGLSAFPGVHLVQPLRVYSGSSLEPFRPGRLDDPVIAGIVASVDEDSLRADIQTLEDFVTRLCVTPQYYAACEWVRDRLISYGISAEVVEFEFTFYGTSYTSYNVVAQKPGLIEPDLNVIICGHLDSITYGNPFEVAPGADDNGSGSATVVEAARILSRYNFGRTIRFVCFGAEELGLIGSEIYAEQAAANGDSIICVMNLDMILFAPDSLRALYVPYNSQSTYLAFDMDSLAALYVPGLDVEVEYAPGVTYSDHASFWQFGYPALLGIEAAVDENPFYHQETDLLENYEEYFPFGTECARAAVALVAVYADPLPEGIEGGSTGSGFGISGVAPVPAASVITVILSGVYDSAEVALYDLTGRRVAGARAEAQGDAEVHLDIAALPCGVYAVRAFSGTTSDSRMVVVAR
jgi:hypothetical protein